MLTMQFAQLLSIFRKLAVGLLLGAVISLLGAVKTANAAETIVLNFQDQQVTVSNQDLSNFAANDVLSADLQSFFQTIPLSTAEARELLNETVVPSVSVSLGRDLNQFLAIQLSRLMGDADGRDSLRQLESVLVAALADDRKFSMLELIDEYPKSPVAVYMDRLEQVHSDVNLFVERVHPILEQADGLVKDLVCDCELEGSGPALLSPRAPAQNQSPGSELNKSKSQPKLSELTGSEVMAVAPHLELAQISQVPAQASSPNPQIAQEVVIRYGPLRRSLTVAELTKLAETGEASQNLKLLLWVAKSSPAEFQTVLNHPINVQYDFLESNLNNVLGEFALFEVGQIVYTESGWANIEALRSAILLSARSDNQISLVEFFQNYPQPRVYINAVKLAKVAQLAGDSTKAESFAESEVQTIEDFLVSLQSSIAADVCTCGARPPST